MKYLEIFHSQEEFPANTDHDWLKSIFSTCGTVSYISLPKYKHNNQVKGFAFIEFTTSEEAQKACQVFIPQCCSIIVNSQR